MRPSSAHTPPPTKARAASLISSTPCRRSPRANPDSWARRSRMSVSSQGSSPTGSRRADEPPSLAHRMMGSDRLMLVSDAMPSVGARSTVIPTFWRAAWRPHKGRLTLADGTLAGAHLTLAEAVKRMARLAPARLWKAHCAWRRDARALSCAGRRIGVLAPGAYADLVAFDANLTSGASWLRGRPIGARRFRRSERAMMARLGVTASRTGRSLASSSSHAARSRARRLVVATVTALA